MEYVRAEEGMDMTTLVLIGLIVVVAKLWFDVGTLRSRLAALESGASWTDFASPELEMERASARLVARVAQAVEPPEPPEPIQAPSPELVAEPISSNSQLDLEPEPAPAELPEPSSPSFGFEDLFGRKLPIWAGGITLAVAGVLIVKYSVDAGLLSPAVRVIFGLLFGTGLIVGAEAALRADARIRDPRVRQALSGAGIATLYASVLVAANLYHLVGPVTAFAGMAGTTVLAGLLSLRFGVPSAVLGLVGGMAAPALVGSGSPDVPLLSAYLALAVGGLCALSRTQRWTWLGVAALIGGFGWGALLIVGGALDAVQSLSLGVYTLLLGIALPVLAFAGARSAAVHTAGSLAACVQLAVLVALGGFGALEWGLFALISAAIVWLSRREAALADLPVAGLTVALLLVTQWHAADADGLALVIGGIAAIYGGPATWRMWRNSARLTDAVQVAAIAVAIPLLPAIRLSLSDGAVSLLALFGAIVAGLVGVLGWRCPTRKEDARFAILAAAAAALLALSSVLAAPAWLVASAIALVAAALLLLAGRADDMRVEWSAWVLGAGSLVALALAPEIEMMRAFGREAATGNLTGAARWFGPALAAALFAWRGRASDAGIVAQPVAVVLGYAAAAQIVPQDWLALVPALLLAGFAADRRTWPAMLTAAAISAGWAAWPLALWLAAGAGALVGMPMLVPELPTIFDMLLRLVIPALALAFAASRQSALRLRSAAIAAAAVLATVSFHIAFKHLFAISDMREFARLGLAERTVWEMLLAAGAVVLWRQSKEGAGAFAVAALAHSLYFTAGLHDPLWAEQAVGAWPVLNLLLLPMALPSRWSGQRIGSSCRPWRDACANGCRWG